MNPKRIKSTAYALLVAGLFLLTTGTCTDNGGFQLAGGLSIVVVVIQALPQAAGLPSKD